MNIELERGQLNWELTSEKLANTTDGSHRPLSKVFKFNAYLANLQKWKEWPPPTKTRNKTKVLWNTTWKFLGQSFLLHNNTKRFNWNISLCPLQYDSQKIPEILGQGMIKKKYKLYEALDQLFILCNLFPHL